MSYQENRLGFVLFVVLATTLGCTSMTSQSGAKSKKKDKSWFSFNKREYQVPQSMTVSWAYDLLTVPGKPVTRGFGGRFYFYNEKSQAIPVDGELIVYGFDDTNGTETTNLQSATKRFKFTSEQLTNHFDEGQLGASYSVWIPWDAAPGDQKKITLLPTFLTKDGRMIRGNSASLHLPGRNPKASEQPSQQTILQASASIQSGQSATQAVANVPVGEPQRSGITTINMPRRVAPPSTPTSNLVEAFEKLEQLQRLELENQMALRPVFQPQIPPAISTDGSTPLAAPTQMMVNPAFAPAPTDMSMTNSKRGIPHSSSGGPLNGWALPEFAQPAFAPPSNRSLPSQLQAPVTQSAPPTSYQPSMLPSQ